jgi:hypothetical protein
LNIDIYFETLFTSTYPQFELLSVEDFVKYCEKLDIRICKTELEYFDKKNLLKPIVSVHRRKINESLPKYEYYHSHSSLLVELYKRGIVQDYHKITFRPWNDYLDGNENTVWLFYHPYQFIIVSELKKFSSFTLSFQSVEENDIDNLLNQLRKYKEDVGGKIERKLQRNNSLFQDIVLLILIQNLYNPENEEFTGNPYVNMDLEKQQRDFLTNRKQIALDIFNRTKCSYDHIENLHENICQNGQINDPLRLWFPLLQLIKKDRIEKLTEKAKIAQEYYKISKLLKCFVFDLFEIELPDPDDVADGDKGIWKKSIYGSPFNYTTPEIQFKIKDHYFINPDYKTVLVYEGETEDLIIKELFKKLNIANNEIILLNLKGQTNIRWSNTSVELFKDYLGMDIHVIMDNDGQVNAMKQDCMKIGIAPNNFHIWNRDFEFDNFGVSKTINRINKLIITRNKNKPGPNQLNLINKQKIIDRLNNDKQLGLMSAIKQEYKQINNASIYLDLIKKPSLAKILFDSRLKTIAKERKNGNWIPTLPVEKLINEIFIKNARWGG